MSDSELACVYSALILHDAGVPISVSLVYGPSLLATRKPGLQYDVCFHIMHSLL